MLSKPYTIPRRCDRINVKVPVTLLVGSDQKKIAHDGYTVDFSQLGVRVRARFALTPGQTIEVIPNEGRMKFSRVAWANSTESDRDGEAGLEFLDPIRAPD